MNQANDASPESPRDVWARKLRFLHGKLATASASEQFSISEEIQQARTRIVELGGDPDSCLQGVSPPRASRPGMTNPIAPTKLPRTGDYLVGRAQELATLTRAWNNPKTNIVQIVAPGGVGKTQLVKWWREGLLDKDDHGGAARAFDWSFYSQGTQQQASADDFFDKALRWFGETEMEKYTDPWAKGERLAALVKGQRTLLILDGLEPLQHPPGPLHGELSDPSLQSLLRGLCDDNPGLCLVTTREAVPDLEHMQPPRCVTIDLNTLDEADGAELLKLYGVRGSDEDLRQASADVGGHSLALVLLATYLAMKCGGDVLRRTEALLFEGHERYAAHAHKVMASYETWFAKQDDIGRAAVVILRLMGLFNRPADPRFDRAVVPRRKQQVVDQSRRASAACPIVGG